MDADETWGEPKIRVEKCYVFKSRLQEYTQKAGLTSPEYEIAKEGPSHEPIFSCTVTVNNVKYHSLPGFFNRKAAEQSAAEIALREILNSASSSETSIPAVHETGLCKNLLQEYAQKMNYAVPSYVCTKSDAASSSFVCTVGVGGIHYVGAAARTKKEAEIKAARTALLAIQSRPEGREGPAPFTVVPEKKVKETDSAEVAPQLGSKKSRKNKAWTRTRPQKRHKCNRGGCLERSSNNDRSEVPVQQLMAYDAADAFYQELQMNNPYGTDAVHIGAGRAHEPMAYDYQELQMNNPYGTDAVHIGAGRAHVFNQEQQIRYPSVDAFYEVLQMKPYGTDAVDIGAGRADVFNQEQQTGDGRFYAFYQEQQTGAGGADWDSEQFGTLRPEHASEAPPAYTPVDHECKKSGSQQGSKDRQDGVSSCDFYPEAATATDSWCEPQHLSADAPAVTSSPRRA